MLERKLKDRIIFLASKGKTRAAKDHLLALDVLQRASRSLLEDEGLVCGGWIDIPRLAYIHKVWAQSNLEEALKMASIIDESWTKQDAEHALKIFHTEDVENSLRALVKNFDSDMVVQAFKLALVDENFLDIYVSKITYRIPRESWLDGFVENWAHQLSKQGIDVEDEKPFLKNTITQILGGFE